MNMNYIFLWTKAYLPIEVESRFTVCMYVADKHNKDKWILMSINRIRLKIYNLHYTNAHRARQFLYSLLSNQAFFLTHITYKFANKPSQCRFTQDDSNSENA